MVVVAAALVGGRDVFMLTKHGAAAAGYTLFDFISGNNNALAYDGAHAANLTPAAQLRPSPNRPDVPHANQKNYTRFSKNLKGEDSQWSMVYWPSPI